MPDAAQHPAQPELPSPYQPGKRRGRARRSHTVAKVLLATLLTLGMVTGLSVAFLYRHLNGNLNVVDVDRPARRTGPRRSSIEAPQASRSTSWSWAPTPATATAATSTRTARRRLRHHDPAPPLRGPRVGRTASASRATPSSTAPTARARTATPSRARTDVMWNDAFSVGGPACTIQQFEQTTGVRDRPLRRRRLRQLQGHGRRRRRRRGLRPRGHRRPRARHHHPGRHPRAQRQGGAQLRAGALRVGDGTDIGRIKRQQAFIAAMADKVISAGTLTRPDRLVRFLDAATKSLTTDIPNIKEIAKVGLQFQDIGLDNDPVHHRAVRLQHRPARPRRLDRRTPTRCGSGSPTTSRSASCRVGSIGADQATSTRGSATPRHEQPERRRERQRVVEHLRRRRTPSPRRPSRRRTPRRRATASRRRASMRARTTSTSPVSARDRPARARSRDQRAEPDWQRKRRLAAVFGDVLPDTTTDERDPARAAGPPTTAATPGSRPRCRRTTAEPSGQALRRWAACSPAGRRAGRGSPASSSMSSGVPGSGLGK